ncbi:MAG: response regulator [Methanolinea sp.]|nr:response regulator [Methanolinea sp.]
MAKILVIDDSRFQRRLISSVLEEKGYEVVTAGDGKEGFAVALRETPDLVICDLLMPGIDGYSFVRMVRKERLGTPVLVFTSDIQKTTRDICLELGACDILNKPVDRETLIPAVERAIGSAKKA